MQTKEFNSLCQTFPAWKSLFQAEVMKMLNDVTSFMEHSPIVIGDKIGYKVHDQISFNIAHGYKTAFAYFHFHEANDISLESLQNHAGLYIGCGNYSYAEIPRMFK